MSYSSTIVRINEIKDRLGITSRVSTVSNNGFAEVLANARNRFNEGPTKIVTKASGAASAQTSPARSLAANTKPEASLASPDFITPNKVNGWSTDLKQMVDAASKRFGVPRELIISVSRAESAFRSDVSSPAGAKGLMQLMPSTAASVGVTNINDPWQNLAGGTKYLRQLMDRFNGDIEKVVAGYNAGPNAVDKYGGVPPYKETEDYVARVRKYANELNFSL